jgi:hypothetical protein
MKRFITVLFILFTHAPLITLSQAGEKTDVDPGQTLVSKKLKDYQLQMRAVKGTPFAHEYSYVLTKGKTYGFLLREDESNPKRDLHFILSDGEGTIVNDQFEQKRVDGQDLSTFQASKTAIYYLKVYSNESYNGSATIAVFELRAPSVKSSLEPCNDELSSQMNKTVKRGFNFLKSYSLSENEITYEYIFTKGTKYLLYVKGSEKKTPDVEVEVVDDKGNFIRATEEVFENGKIFEIECAATGTHALNFKVKGQKCVMAQLSFYRP